MYGNSYLKTYICSLPMDAVRNIRHLLYFRDCIIVPEFGAFVVKSFPAEINHATQMFLPPSRRLSFQPALKKDDLFLVNHLATHYGMSHQAARTALAKITAEWSKTIENGERLRLEGLGLFYRESSGQWAFKPQVDSNFSTEAFGLSIFRSPAIKRETPTPVTETIIKRLPVQKASSNGRIWRATAVAAGVASLLYVGSMKADFQAPSLEMAGFNLMQYSKALTFMEEDDSKAEAANISEETSIDETAATPVEAPMIAAPVEVVHSPKANLNHHFFVVVGSFVEQGNANDLANSLIKQGFNASILPYDGKYHKVSIASFANRDSATVALRNYKTQIQHGAWIYSK